MICIENISSGYGKKCVINDASACIERKKLTAVIGPNGCGKSTLLKTIIGIVPLRSGEIEVDGCKLSAMGQADIAKKIAYLPQSKDTPDMTVAQAVLHGRFPHLSFPRRYGQEDRERARKAMDIMEISHLAEVSLKELSGGMRQNAYIAMALCQGSDCILLDEPATHLDISHTLGLMRELRGLADNGHAVVAVMHDIPMALDLADEVIVMDEGRIVVCGCPAEIAESAVIDRIFGVGVERFSCKDGSHYKYDFR